MCLQVRDQRQGDGIGLCAAFNSKARLRVHCPETRQPRPAFIHPFFLGIERRQLYKVS
jgi:hypothetical protein